jgi:hypothetical protein
MGGRVEASDMPLLTRHTLRAFWEAPHWGGGFDRGFALALLVGGTCGIVTMHRDAFRPAARLLGVGLGGLFALTLAGTTSELLCRLGCCQLLLPALLFATIPAAALAAWSCDRLHGWSGSLASPVIVVVALPVLVWLVLPGPCAEWGRRLQQPEPLLLGLNEQRQGLVEAMQRHTTDEARILWEDLPGRRTGSRWTALLPVLTGRSFVGGLDIEAGIEHATSGLVAGKLAGQSLAEMSDRELDDYCRRYNIGWIACWSSEAKVRLERWAGIGTTHVIDGRAGEPGRLLALKRQPSFALTGSVRWRSADSRCILLADAVPRKVGNEAEGQVVLSLHYQAGMRVRPARVRLEQAVDSHDNIPFVRLRMSEPVGRVMITWEGR